MFLGKWNDKMFKKMQNTLFWSPFCPNLGKKLFFHKIGLRHFLVSILYQTNSEKNSYLMDEQTNELLWWNQ